MRDQAEWAPLEVTPETAGTAADAHGLTGWLRELDDLAGLLTQEKVLLFRGFRVTPEEFGGIKENLLPRPQAYVHGNSPRTRLGNDVYTSTEYPPAYTITMHNELSYAHRWPSRLLFYCERPADTGGATPVVDGEKWLNALDPDVRKAFAPGLRYSQNLHPGVGMGKSWQATFETEDKDVVEAFLAETGADWEWRGDGTLRVTLRRPATLRHPVTGTEVWFNQADQWHVAGLGAQTAAALAQIMAPEDFPQSVTFADGSPIPAEHVEHVADRGLAAAVDVSWRAGDLMLIDNVLVAHGRRPFTGSRRVLVAMSG